MEHALHNSCHTCVRVEVGVELSGIFAENFLAFIRNEGEVAAETKIAQTNPGDVNASVLNNKRESESDNDFYNKHDAVHLFVRVMIK